MGRPYLRVLVLSFYYHPDLSAGSFRTAALVNALSAQLPAAARVDVVTTMPNRYGTFGSSEAMECETHASVEVRRIRLPPHKSGMADQSRAFFHFARETRQFVRSRHYDLVYATSSRLMTAALGAWIASQQHAKLYLDIRDIFVDTIKEVLPPPWALLAKPFFSLAERWTITRADRVNLVSAGFKSYFDTRYPHVHYSFFTNGVDAEFVEAGAHRKNHSRSGLLTVLYAGNIGEGQGLHLIVPALAKKMRGRVLFKVIGDGGRKAALQAALQRGDVNNVELLPPMSRERLIKAYQQADVLFLHLNDYEAFKKVLPSKLFEYAAMCKPIWAGVAGHAADFVRSEINNAAVFQPNDAAEAQKVFANLSFIETPRREFIEKFSRDRIMKSMAADLLELTREAC